MVPCLPLLRCCVADDDDEEADESSAQATTRRQHDDPPAWLISCMVGLMEVSGVDVHANQMDTSMHYGMHMAPSKEASLNDMSDGRCSRAFFRADTHHHHAPLCVWPPPVVPYMMHVS